jgi:Soluble lytic murein transglycosylase and related regulatory proteins (some contain LysM/invasin domains)
LTIGKLVAQRGMPVDSLAFPTNGIPHYEALKDSAAAPIVYSVARQESAFLPRVVSKAGARGLMQMIDATARHTAMHAGVAYDRNRMLKDASFNAQLGAAHLGTLIKANGGSLIMTFAAYNAGGGRVQQWVEAYGDPRKPGVDAIDWVERIPFAETRDYVQRVVANVAMYSIILKEDAKPDPIAQAMQDARDGSRTLAAWLPPQPLMTIAP